MKKRSLFLAFASMFMLASCGSNSEQEKEEVLITSVGVNPTSLELVAGSAPTEVAYRVFGRGEYDKSVSVSTSAQAVATAELVEGQERFKVTPVAVGEAVITVKSKADESKAATLNVTVKENQVKPTKPHVTNLTLDKTAARCKEGDPAIEFTVTLEGEGNFDVGFIINNEHPDLVDVDATEGASGSSFHVTPKAAGTALIDVISKENADIKQQIQVLIDPVIPEPERVVITTEPLRKLIDINEEFNITVKEHTHPVEWSVTQEGNIVELSNQSDDSVTVKTLAYGEAKVTATVRGSEEIVSSDTYIEVVESGEFKGYKAILDGSIEISLVKGEPGRSGVVEHYEATLSDVSAGTRIDFAGITKGGYDLITNGIGPDADDKDGGKRNNLKPTAAGQVDFTVQNDITSEKLYFDIWEDGGCSFWLDGGLSYVEGFFLSVNGIPTAQLVKNDQYVGEGEEYMALGVSLNANDVIALYDGSTDASWMPPLEQGGSSECFTLDKGKTVCLATATYDFYIKLIYQNDTVYVTSSEPIVEPVYTFAINGGSQITLIKCDDDKPEGVNHQYAASVSFTAGDKLTFYRDGVEFNSITVEGGNNNVNSSFEILETFAPEEGHNSIYLKHMSDSSFVLYVAGKTFVAPYKVVGIGGKWDYADGVQMVKKEGSDTEYVAEISVNALDNIKIRSDEDAWFSNWKTDCGEDNAIDNLEAYICGEEGDSKGNLIFRVAGTFKVYFETDPSNAGIYVATESVTSPYTGRINESLSAPFSYHNVELYPEHGGRIEYMIKDADLVTDTKLEILKGDVVQEIEVENGGAKELFDITETSMTYKGEGGTYTFYLKEDLEDPTELTLFIAGDTPTPVSVYNLHLNRSGDTEWVDLAMSQTEDKTTQYEIKNLELGAGDQFVVNLDGTWFNAKNLKGDNNLVNVVGDNIVIKEAGNYDIYCDTNTADGQYGIWIAKSPAPIDNTYSVKLLDNKGDLVSQESLKYKEDTGEYYIDNIALSSSYDIEFYHGDDKLAISPKDSDAENANNCAIKINTTDVLTIVRSAEAAEGKGIFLNPTEGEVWVSGNYVSLSVIIDKDTVENQLTFHKNDVDGSGNAYTEYSFTFEEIEDNKEIHFFKNGLAINAGPEAGEGNNAESAKWQGIFDCCTVKKGGKNLTVYLKVFENGSYSVWVGEAKGEIVTKTYTITCDQTGAFDNCEVFIWAWGDGVDGKFYATYVVAGKYGLSFDVPEGVDHFLVVRCYVGTTQPSWDEKGDAPGRIYNQTADITIDSMTTTYPITFPNW